MNSGGAGPVSAEWMIPKALWLKHNEPTVFEEAAHICEYQDFMNFHLTGRMTASLNNVTVRWHYSSDQGWPSSLLAALDLKELVHKWPPVRVHSPHKEEQNDDNGGDDHDENVSDDDEDDKDGDENDNDDGTDDNG